MLQVIAIDGVSGSGKSSTAGLLAGDLGFAHLDTGAMYRFFAHKALELGLGADREPELGRLAESLEFSFGPDGGLLAGGKPLPGAIRGPEVSAAVSDYCKPKPVREALARKQRELGLSRPCVAEGRDMATVVFPDAS